MSDLENIKSTEIKSNKKRKRKIFTHQNSPISHKNNKNIKNNNSINVNNFKKKIKIKLKTSKSKRNKYISNDENKNDIGKIIDFNIKSQKELNLKNKNLKSFSLKSPENKENSIILKKLENIQVQTNLMKNELKRYKDLEKYLEKKGKSNSTKNIQNIETIKFENLNNKNKVKNFPINDINNDQLKFHKIDENITLNSQRIKTKNILIDFINDLLNDRKRANIKNNSISSNFNKFKKNKLTIITKPESQNNSIEMRKKAKVSKYSNLSHTTEMNKSKNKSKYINEYNLNINKKYKNLSPINKKNIKKLIITSGSKKSNTKKILYHKIDKYRIETYNKTKTDIKIESKEKSHKINKKFKMKLLKTEENTEKSNKKIFNESKIKSQQDISFEYLAKNKTNENIRQEKEILTIEKLCKKGYSGDEIDKPNQDNYFIYRNFNNNSNNIYIGVCDGHGPFGHEISSFLVTNLPLVLGNYFRIFNIKDISTQNNENLLSIITTSFQQVNKNLSLEKDIDSSLSGSTCNSLIYTPKKVFCANIGDSRCIIGKFDGKNWKSKSLSTDHKPELEKEKERIIKNGGIINQIKDKKGEFIGPLRVWVKETDFPGLAISRSFGDDIAHQIGVNCEPEIIEYNLNEEDKFIILASDGIWQFISNQECVNIVKDYYIKENYKGALKHLYKESCKRWLDEEDSIDDITLIIIFFK